MADIPPFAEPSIAQSRMRWLAGAGMLGGGEVIALAVGGVASILLARTLRPSGFGTYSVLSVSVSLATLVAIFGLDTHLITELRPGQVDRRSYGTLFRLCVEITLVLCIPATALVVVLTHGAIRAAGLLAVGELILTPFLLGRYVLVTQMQQGRIAAVGVANRLVLLAGVVLIALAHPSPPLVWMMLVSALAVAVEAILLGALTGPPVGWLHRLGPRRRRLLAACWPLAAAGLAGVAYNRVDQLLLAAFRGPTEVGKYAVAVNLASLLGVISSVVYTTTLPGVIEVCRAPHLGPARRVVEDMALLMFLPGGLGIAVVAGAGGSIARLLFGSAYSNEHALIAVLAFAELGVFVGTTVAAVLVAVDRRRALFAGVAAALGLNIVLNLVLLPKYGAIAAAWVSLGSYAVAAIVAVLRVPEARRIARPLVGVTIKVGGAASVGAVAGTAMTGLVPAVVASSLAYMAIAALLFNRDLLRLHHRLLHGRARPGS